MKKIIPLFVLVVLFSACGKPKSVVGTWQIVSMKENDYYHNFENDSTSVSPELLKRYKDSASAKIYVRMTTAVFDSVTYSFYKDGKLEVTVRPQGKSITENATYTVDADKKQITRNHTTAEGKPDTYTFSYGWNGDRLQLIFPMEGGNTIVDEFKKVKDL